MTRRNAVRLAAAAAALSAACAAMAVDIKPSADPAPPPWSALTPAQQSALAPLQKDWSGIDAPRKQKWIEIAQRFPTLGEPERKRVQARMAEWARMTPAERGTARLQFQELRTISAEDKQARWEAYQALPDDERRALAQRGAPAAKAASVAAAAASAAAVARLKTPPPDTTPKRNILPVPTTAQTSVKTVAPTVVQARPGATTTLLTTRQDSPAHQQPGLPKVAATPGFVNPHTLLPKMGPQGAAVSAAASATPPHP